MPLLRRLPALLLLFVAANLAVFGAPWTALALAGVGALGAWRPRRTLLAALLVAGWPVPLLEYADRVEQLAAEPRWTDRDRASVWVLHLGMAGAGAALGLREVAWETALLIVPGPEERRGASDFALGSPAVRAALRRQVGSLPPASEATGPVALPPQRVVFRGGLADESARVALALNPVALTGWARPTARGWALDLEATVPVDYPAGASLPLVTVFGRRVAIDEGLFDRLERDGWLFPYAFTWTWTMAADDPRLSADGVGRAWAEEVVCAAVCGG